MTQISRITLYRWIAAAFIAIAASMTGLPAQAQGFHGRGDNHGRPPAYHGREYGRPIYHGGYSGGDGGDNGLIVGALMGAIVGVLAAGALQPPPPVVYAAPPPPPPPGVDYYYPGN